jgi:phosphatidylglycerophosphate synthase
MELGEVQQTERPGEKSRHGCLAAYLILLMASTLLGSVSYLLMSEQTLVLNDPELPVSVRRPLMVLLNVLMALCAFAIWRWKKWGFWGFIAVGLSGGLLRAYFSPDHRGGLVFVVAGSLLLYGVLRIGKERQGWKQLD